MALVMSYESQYYDDAHLKAIYFILRVPDTLALKDKSPPIPPTAEPPDANIKDNQISQSSPNVHNLSRVCIEWRRIFMEAHFRSNNAVAIRFMDDGHSQWSATEHVLSVEQNKFLWTTGRMELIMCFENPGMPHILPAARNVREMRPSQLKERVYRTPNSSCDHNQTHVIFGSHLQRICLQETFRSASSNARLPRGTFQNVKNSMQLALRPGR
ncbi:hypothetical protein TNCV_4006681 [Trichonephila clavipes]|nr:hypothetical protein TNCV_4006681 [Trichonephila clavipes]